MEELFEQLLTFMIYAPIPIAVLWLLIGSAFSKANRLSHEKNAQNRTSNSDSLSA